MLRQLRKIVFINKIIGAVLITLKNKSNAFLNFLIRRWPASGIVKCKFNNRPFLMFNKCDDGLVNYFHYNFKYHEEGDLKLFEILSKSCKTILDVGANTGLYSILTSKSNPAANIIAFEPYYTNYKRLLKNLELNGCKNVTCEQIALGERNGEVEFTIPEDDSITDVSSINASFSKRVYKNVKWKTSVVPIKTLDDYRNEKKINIDLIKCDVETYEVNFFKGLDTILKEDKPTILFESFMIDERKIFFNEVLKKYNYHLYLVLEQGIVHLREGFGENRLGINFLISAVEPTRSFVPYDELDSYKHQLLSRVV